MALINKNLHHIKQRYTGPPANTLIPAACPLPAIDDVFEEFKVGFVSDLSCYLDTTTNLVLHTAIKKHNLNCAQNSTLPVL